MNNGETRHIHEELLNESFHLDEPTFEKFFRETFVSGCSFCRARFGFDTELAKEVVHTAFIKLWENRQRIFIATTLRSYLLRIISNSSLDVIKQEKTRQQYSKFFLETMQEAAEEPGTNSTEYKQLAADINNAIANLPEQMQTIFKLSRYGGLKYSAIASQLNISPKTVETQMSRALVKMREKLGHYLLFFIITIVLLKIF